ncbi:MAG: SH3 domain-containing protein [Thermomicrobiales bacterium]
MNRAEEREARQLAHAIDARLAGSAVPTDRPEDLDPLIALLATHRATVRAAASTLPLSRPRPAPSRAVRISLVGGMVIAALIVGVIVWNHAAVSSDRTVPRTSLVIPPIASTVAGIESGPLPTPAGAPADAGAQGFTSGDCPSVSAPGVLGLDGRQIIQSSAYFYFHVRETAAGSIEMWADTVPTNTAPVRAGNQIAPLILAVYVDDLLSACHQSRQATIAANVSASTEVIPITTVSPPMRYQVTNTNGADLNVREQPTTESRPLTRLTDGTEVQVTGVGTSLDGNVTWYRVQVGDTTGYVRKEFLQPVTPAP